MQGRVGKNDEPITRVKCVVDSCHYYGQGNHCLAQHIEIQPRNADSTEITDCATFVHK